MTLRMLAACTFFPSHWIWLREGKKKHRQKKWRWKANQNLWHDIAVTPQVLKLFHSADYILREGLSCGSPPFPSMIIQHPWGIQSNCLHGKVIVAMYFLLSFKSIWQWETKWPANSPKGHLRVLHRQPVVHGPEFGQLHLGRHISMSQEMRWEQIAEIFSQTAIKISIKALI